MAEMNDVLYLESDEEITTAIDKMLGMKSDQVSIVVPKRSALLQSIVNLRLLKKAASDAGKELVLVTGDRTATHLAGKVGLAVAATLKAKAVMPEVKALEPDDTSEIVEGEEDEEASGGSEGADGTPADTTPSHAERRDKPDFAKPMMVRTPIKADAAADQPKTKARLPNFMAFQRRTFIVAAAVAVVLLGIILNYFLKSATVTLYAKGTKVAASFDFSVDPSAKDSDSATAMLAGQALKLDKTLTGSFTPTGKKDVGTKATGEVTVSNCYDAAPSARTLPAGSKFVAPDGKIFVSNADVTVPGGTGNFVSGCTSPGTAKVSVTASQNGDGYNLASGTRYSVQGYPSDSKAGIYGTGSQMTGGTSKTVNVVTQSDIDSAKADLLAKDADQSHKDLDGKTATGYEVIKESFTQTVGAVTSSPAVDNEGDQATLTVAVSYTELAVSKADFPKIVEAQEQKQVGIQNQIYDNGIGNAKITAGKADSPGGRQDFHFNADAYAGARLDTKAIAKQLTGKTLGAATNAATQLPGVERAEINVSPAWSTKLPHITSHIKVVVKVANGG